jgi:release factor glutamine methyltransferase
MKIRDAISRGTLAFQAAGIPTPRLDAELLTAAALSVGLLDLIKEPDRLMSPEETALFETYVARRLRKEPVAYIRGYKEFWSLPFQVNPGVLIPRPETELLVEETLALFPHKTAARILEVGTGSGAIAVALAREMPCALITATDISVAALDTARANATNNGVAGRIDFLAGDLLDPIQGKFAAIVSNLPYLGETEWALLPPGVKDYEPPPALLGGRNGLELIGRLIATAGPHLARGGNLLLEIGAGQQEEVAALLAQAGFVEIGFRRDYSGHWRVARGRRDV